MVVHVNLFFVYSRIVTESVRKWKKIKYCPFTKWLTFSVSGHCERIFKFQLTMDGIWLAWKGETIDFYRERELLLKLYKSPSAIRGLMHNNNFTFLFSRSLIFDIKTLAMCPFTLWIYRQETCGCDIRLSLFKLCIDECILFKTYKEFDVVEASEKYERIYRQMHELVYFISRKLSVL